MQCYCGRARAVNDQAECLEDQILADVFGFESGVNSEGSSSLVLYYLCPHKQHTVARNTQLLYI